MKGIETCFTPRRFPVRMLQFGTGGFLRAFIDEMIDRANEKGLMDCGIALLKSTRSGNLDAYKKQNGLYTVSLRGSVGGKPSVENRVITAVQAAYDSEADYDAYMALADSPEMKFIVSNTTEAGIVFDASEVSDARPPRTYPGKLAQFLFRRYRVFEGDPEKGLIIIPTELIERNGEVLKEAVLSLSEVWKVEEGFAKWLNTSCVFCSTLVDRIVTGAPKDEKEALFEEFGYRDDLLDFAEPFGLLVIESERDISAELPLKEAGCPVLFTADQRPYRERKVRILNGAHTSTVPLAFLCGKAIVREAMQDTLLRSFMERVVLDEIVPTVPLPKEDAEAFAYSVFERFENPFVDHALLSILLNSVSKWKARVLPSFRDRVKADGVLPPFMTFSFAALLAFYSDGTEKDGNWVGCRNGVEYPIMDDSAVIAFFKENSCKPAEELVSLAAARTDFWGEDLSVYPGFVKTAGGFLESIRTRGAEEAARELLLK